MSHILSFLLSNSRPGLKVTRNFGNDLIISSTSRLSWENHWDTKTSTGLPCRVLPRAKFGTTNASIVSAVAESGSQGLQVLWKDDNGVAVCKPPGLLVRSFIFSSYLFCSLWYASQRYVKSINNPTIQTAYVHFCPWQVHNSPLATKEDRLSRNFVKDILERQHMAGEGGACVPYLTLH